MRLKTIVVKLLPNFLLARFGINFGIGEFAFDKKLDVRTDIKAKYGFSGELLELFVNNIFGIDIDPKCAQFNGQAGQVRIGSQDDPIFLESVINEMGGVDLILDDGSHHMDHIQTTLNYLFPKLSDGGSYMIEDLHTAYWKNYGGGYRSKSNFFGFVSDLVDDMHHWYHLNKVKQPSVSNHCASIHIHDSIVVIEKDRVFAPTHSEIS